MTWSVSGTSIETSPEVLSFASKFSEYLSDEVEFGAVFNIDSINIASKAHVHGLLTCTFRRTLTSIINNSAVDVFSFVSLS